MKKAALGDLQNFVTNNKTSSMAVFSAVSASYALTASYALNAGAGSGTELFIYQTSSLVKAQVGKIHFTGSGVDVIASGSDGVLVRILGGGGSGGVHTPGIAATAGAVNKGGGGGGGNGSGNPPGGQNGASGGSGIVIIRAPASAGMSVSPGTNTISTLPAPAGGCKVATFTVSGTLTT